MDNIQSSYHDRDDWIEGPNDDIKQKKLKLEEELMIKLGAKKEVIEYHPLILSSRVERAKSFVGLQYTRVHPPLTEKSTTSRNSWLCQDQALRQMSNPARRGPRDVILPNLVKSYTEIKVNQVPEADFGFFSRREAILERLTQVLSEWTVYQKRAFPPLISRLAYLEQPSSLSQGAKQTKAVSLSGPERRRRKSGWSLSASSENSGDGQRVRHRRKRSRWSKMAQEVFLQMKACHMRLPLEMPKSELRIYVSSTPDLHEEREFLEEVAYPKLKELAEKLGLNCHFVDMRKGSGHLSNDIETFDLIKKELQNCRRLSIGPYFISLLGHQLDDERLPGFLEKAVYEEIRETLIRDDIIGVEMFDEAYRLDSNRLPPVYIKQPLQAIDEYQGPEHVEQILLSALNKAVELIKQRRNSRQTNDVDFYKWSAVVREVECGLLKSYNPRRETLCFLFDDNARHVPSSTPESKSPIERLRSSVATHFKRYNGKDSLMHFKTGKKTLSYLRSLADTFIAGVASLLKCQLRQLEFDVTQQLTEGSEALQHVRIALTEAENTVGNIVTLANVREKLDTYAGGPLTILLEGANGMGKTTLASQIAKSSSLWQPRWKVVFRSLGYTLRSSSLFRALESLIKQLSFIYSLDVSLPLHAGLNDALRIFCDVLKHIAENQNQSGVLLLILDHLDKLPEMDSHFLLTLLNALGDGIILILTFDTESELLPLLRSQAGIRSMNMTSLNKVEINDFIRNSLSRLGRRVTGDQLKTVLKAIPQESSPIYLQLVFHIIRWWPSHTLPELGRFVGKAERDFDIFLEILEADFGKAFTRYALSFMAAARHGLGDNELVHLLAEDSDLLNEIKDEQVESVSVVEGFSYQVHLSRLLAHLGNFVLELKMEGETVFQLCSRSLVRSIKNKYLSDSFFYTIHKRLAMFFLFIRRGLLLSSKDISENKHQHLVKLQWRTLRCVPFHLCHSSDDPTGVWNLLKEKVFFNFSWIVNEVYSGFYNDFLNDIQYALEQVDLDPHIQYLQHFLISIRHSVIHNPMSLAAIFSSQNIQEADAMKDSIRAIVQEAREWLKQVHTQTLVPQNYTSDKTNRLLIKRNNIRGVDELLYDGVTSHLFVLRGRCLTSVKMVTGEEISLAVVHDDVHEMNVTENGEIIVITKSEDQEFNVEIINVQKGKHLKSISLETSELMWFDFRSINEAYFATTEGIKVLDVERRQIRSVLTMRKRWHSSHVTLGNEKVVTILVDERLRVDILSLKQGDYQRISFKSLELNQNCNPILSTKDGKYIVLVFERQAVVIDANKCEELESLSLNGLPIIHAVLSRSHEHLFLAYANAAITCHVLYTGNQSMVTKFIPKVQQSPGKTRGGKSPRPPSGLVSPSGRKFSPLGTSSPTDDVTGRQSGRKNWTKNKGVETITTMITSEDDHFLFVGTTRGLVYAIHVPTGHQVVAIWTHRKAIKKLIFLTNREHFQHLVTLNEEGRAFHWNLRPLLKQARILLHNYIIDDDLLKEEQPKRELSKYFPIFNAHRSDRVFLNGPDIAAFYKDSPADIFGPLEELDPAFKPVKDWEETGTIADCSDYIKVFVSGNKLGDILLTISRDQRLARWSLHDGHLVWARKLHYGHEKILDAALVYYDQALLLTEKSDGQKGLRISVIYIGENQTKVLSKSHVIGYWASGDRCQIMIMCRDPAAREEISLCHWDLINARQEVGSYEETVCEDRIAKENVLFTTFSPDLTQMVRLSLVTEDNEESNTPRNPTVFGKIRKASSLPNLGVKGRQYSATRKRPLSGMAARRLGSITPDLFRSSSQQIDVTFQQEDFDQHSESFPMEEDVDNLKEAETERFNITTLLSWNKLYLRNREYAHEAQRRSQTNSRLSFSERSDDASPAKPAVKSPKGENNQKDASFPEKILVGETADKTSNEKHVKASEGNVPTIAVQETDDTWHGQNRDEPTEMDEKEIEKQKSDGDTTMEDAVDTERKDNDEEQGTEELYQNSCKIRGIELSAISFMGEENILIGTNCSHVMLLDVPAFKVASVFTSDEPRLVSMDNADISVADVETPHKGVVNFVGSSEDGSKLISVDSSGVVCLWNTEDRSLAMTILMEDGQEITHMVMSRDAAIVVIATNERVLDVWTSIGTPRRIASHMATFDILDLQMSCDCHKVIVGGEGQEEEFLLEIFEVKNVDDVLMHVPVRKRSQEEEKSDEGKEQPRRRESRRLSTRRRSSVNVTDSMAHANR